MARTHTHTRTRTALIALLGLTLGLSTLAVIGVEAHPGGDDGHAHHHIMRRQLAGGGEGGPGDGPTSSPEAAGYSCDPNTCRLPNCNCASVRPPGGLDPAQTPQFITLTADDAIQIYTTRAVNGFLAQRRNPNGCAPKMTYFTSLTYCNYSMVTDWYVAGNEIADHTMTHVGSPSQEEINGNLAALNAFSGIPLSSIQGFRAPFLNYTRETFDHLQAAGFTYDSSVTSATPANDPNTDAFWPYTLDNGLANDCLSVPGICKGQPRIPGFWEIPMYAIFDQRGVAGVHLMDPWLDDPNPDTVQGWLRDAFNTHYNGNRQPFGLYTHPIHVATGYPGVPDPTPTINMINAFLDWAQQQPNVWIVSNEQLLAWMRDPKPIDQLDQVAALRCPTPNVQDKICNGMPDNEQGLLQNCPFTDFPWTTCYGCPTQPPTPAQPLPPQASSSGGLRYRLPANCSTPFWDPIKGECLCRDSGCAFTDDTRAIGPNGANLTGGGTGNSPSAAATSSRFRSFSGATSSWNLNAGVAVAIGVAALGVVVGGTVVGGW